MNIFISYRRGDSIATAGRIRDRLVRVFGRKRVFVDVDDIPHGQDFVKVLVEKVAECRVLLAIIGPHWLEASDESGNRRLEDSNDFVRIEISSALASEKVTVIPVLIDGARMPATDLLPEPMQALTRRNAIELRNTQFGSDVERLVRAIRSKLGVSGHWYKVLGGLLIAGLICVSIVVWHWHQKPAGKLDPRQIADTIAQLRNHLGKAEGRVHVGIKGGNRVRLGSQIIFEVNCMTQGHLILVDINTSYEVTQIAPNKFVAERVTACSTNRPTVSVPGPDYPGFRSFQAVEPVGRGRLIALVYPETISPPTLTDKASGFASILTPDNYLKRLVEFVANSVWDLREGKGGEWAFAITEYEITK